MAYYHSKECSHLSKKIVSLDERTVETEPMDTSIGHQTISTHSTTFSLRSVAETSLTDISFELPPVQVISTRARMHPPPNNKRCSFAPQESVRNLDENDLAILDLSFTTNSLRRKKTNERQRQEEEEECSGDQEDQEKEAKGSSSLLQAITNSLRGKTRDGSSSEHSEDQDQEEEDTNKLLLLQEDEDSDNKLIQAIQKLRERHQEQVTEFWEQRVDTFALNMDYISWKIFN